MTDDDLTPWNPAYFGHTDFQKESDGQLTIFFEDAHEPPDPDDFASIADYEIAWTEREQTQTLPQEDTIMNFQLTTPFDSEIEQLKARLAELETQKHRVSTCANRIVEQVGECVIEMKEAGVSNGILSNWACVIYKEITGEDVPALSNSDVLKGAIAWEEKYKEARQKVVESVALCKFFALENQKIKEELQKLQSGNSKDTEEPFKIDLLKKVSDLTIERDTALERLAELEKLNASNARGIAQLSVANQELCEKLDKLNKPEELEESSSPSQNDIPVGVRVEVADPAYSNYPRGIVAAVSDDGVSVHFHKTDETEEETVIFPASSLNVIPKDPGEEAQEIVSEFLRKLDRISRVDKLDWVKIKELPLNIETMRELGLQAKPKSKTHSYLLEQMPVICASYVSETGDRSDLEWLPKHFVERVEYLLKIEALGSASHESTGEEEESKKPPRSTSLSEAKPTIQRGDSVRHLVYGERTVLDVNGEWINVKDPDGLTDMWNISDVELVA